MTFCYIPAGDFWMGSRDGFDDERPRHRVHIAQPFWLGQTPVTLEQFQCFRVRHQNEYSGDLPQHPVVNVNWQDAIDFCKWLTRRHMVGEGKKTKSRPWHGCRATLPTEAQWEYACRARTLDGKSDHDSLVETDYWSGDGEQALNEVGWFAANSGGILHRVGMKSLNKWGLHDMHGLVWEYCADIFDDAAFCCRASEALDPFIDEGKGVAEMRVQRGGSWNTQSYNCRTTSREYDYEGNRDSHDGFRIAIVRGVEDGAPSS
jgi:formylglycine-generating enzyme required for sulfatase activity